MRYKIIDYTTNDDSHFYKIARIYFFIIPVYFQCHELGISTAKHFYSIESVKKAINKDFSGRIKNKRITYIKK